MMLLLGVVFVCGLRLFVLLEVFSDLVLWFAVCVIDCTCLLFVVLVFGLLLRCLGNVGCWVFDLIPMILD